MATFMSSTRDVLNSLYDKVVLGGVVVIDDYALKPCRAALSDFLAARGLKPKIYQIDWTGVWVFLEEPC